MADVINALVQLSSLDEDSRSQALQTLTEAAKDIKLRTENHVQYEQLWLLLQTQLRNPNINSLPNILVVLRVLRNLCAGFREHQEHVIDGGLLPILHRLALWLLHHAGDDPNGATCLVVTLQVLCNAATQNERFQAVCWSTFHTGAFTELLTGSDAKCAALTVRLIKLCIGANATRSHDMFETSQGLETVSVMLVRTKQLHADEQNDTFDLVSEFLRQHSLSGALSRTLFALFANGKIAELQTLLQIIEAHTHSASEQQTSVDFPSVFVEAICDVLRRLLNGGEGEPTWSQSIAALSEAVSEARTGCVLFALELLGNVALQSKIASVTMLSAGLLETLFGMLTAAKQVLPRGSRSTASIEHFESSPIFGLKRQAIRLVGNMAAHSRVIQDRVRELEGLSIILDHCSIDDYNPYIREWAILAIRSLCDGNPENQAVIANLERLQPAPNPELRDLGLQVRLAEDGKVMLDRLNNDKTAQ